jgi:ubiquinone/menaquinone biosynthesis C-methylase UbiE
MTLGQRFARVTTEAAVRWPRLWPVFRRAMEKQFDSIAPRWDTMRGPESLAPFRAALGAVDTPPDDVLDVGTGTAEGVLAIGERFPDSRVLGVDLSERMLERAREKAPNARFERADASALPFPPASFDLVTHANMIPFFDEVARVLRPGGHALFAFSVGAETPIYVSADRLRGELEGRGFVDFAEFAAGNGTALLARKQ